MRIFFCTDIHGSDVCFRKFINAGSAYGVDFLILGGDITGKILVPIVKTGGVYKSYFLDKEHEAQNESELAKLKEIISFNGFYPYITDEEGVRKLRESEDYKNEVFKHLILERLRSWIRLAEQRLSDKRIKCFINGGNDDILEIDQVLDSSPSIIHPEGKVLELDGGYEMISTGFTNKTPWNCPRDITEEELERKLESMISNVKNPRKCIFNTHCPPFDSTLDMAPALDSELRPIVKGTQIVFKPVGSQAVRKCILEHQPLLGLHGHVHESKSYAKIGRTLCVNPGSDYPEGLLRGVIVELQGDSVKRYSFTCG
jgi:Icc-related predicted phosphoesterase